MPQGNPALVGLSRSGLMAAAQIACPKCRTALSVSDSAQPDQVMRCPKCGTHFRLAPARPPAPSTVASHPSAAPPSSDTGPILVTCSACTKTFRAQRDSAGRTVTCPHCKHSLVIAGPGVSPFDVFVSYSSKDKHIADAAVATLEAKGIRCWIAPRDIVPGKEWSE